MVKAASIHNLLRYAAKYLRPLPARKQAGANFIFSSYKHSTPNS